MFTHETTLRVRYSETDRMGYAYNGNYPQYFEVARVEALRSLGFPYKELEDKGILLPVSEMHIKYLKPAHYDDELLIKTSITEPPKSARLHFAYELFNQNGTKLTEGTTILVFVDKDSGRPMRAPELFLEALNPYFG